MCLSKFSIGKTLVTELCISCENNCSEWKIIDSFTEKQAKIFEKLLWHKNIQIAMLPIYYTNFTEPLAFLEEDLRCLIAFSLMGKNHRFINSGCAIEARQFKFINNQWHKRLQLTKINTIISETRKLWDKNKLGY